MKCSILGVFQFFSAFLSRKCCLLSSALTGCVGAVCCFSGKPGGQCQNPLGSCHSYLMLSGSPVKLPKCAGESRGPGRDKRGPCPFPGSLCPSSTSEGWAASQCQGYFFYFFFSFRLQILGREGLAQAARRWQAGGAEPFSPGSPGPREASSRGVPPFTVNKTW